MRIKLFWVVAIVYILITSFYFLQSAVLHASNLHFLYPDQATVLRIEAGQTENATTKQKEIAKLFYNKPLGYLQTYIDNVYRSVDVPFLFTLTNGSSMYDDQGPMQMLFLWEFLFFIPACIFLIRSQNKKYIWLAVYVLSTIIFAAFLLPALSQLKLFPEILGIRFVIIFGLYEGVKKWLKK